MINDQKTSPYLSSLLLIGFAFQFKLSAPPITKVNVTFLTYVTYLGIAYCEQMTHWRIQIFPNMSEWWQMMRLECCFYFFYDYDAFLLSIGKLMLESCTYVMMLLQGFDLVQGHLNMCPEGTESLTAVPWVHRWLHYQLSNCFTTSVCLNYYLKDKIFL